MLELGSTVASPFCGGLLADFSAEVVKVEPSEGDPVRSMGKHMEGKSLYGASIFRNKRLIALDPRKSKAQQLVRRMIPQFDVLICAPNILCRTSDGRFIALAVASDSVFNRLAEVMQRPDLVQDPRSFTAIERVRNDDALDEIIGAWRQSIKTKDVGEKEGVL